MDLHTLYWPGAQLGEALEALARISNLAPQPSDLPAPSQSAGNDTKYWERWIVSGADWLGIEAEQIQTTYADVEHLLQKIGPCIFLMPGDDQPQFLLCLGNQYGKIKILAPNLQTVRIATKEVRHALCHPLEKERKKEIETLLIKAGVSPRRRPKAHNSILREQLGGLQLSNGWSLHLPPGAPLWSHIRRSNILSHVGLFVGTYIVQYSLWILSWWVLGKGVLQGRLDDGWLYAWALLLLSLVPFQLLATWAQGILAISAGSFLKIRLLYGALKLKPEEIRHQGAGQLLSRVIESEAVESLALSGGFLGLVAGIELVISGMVLSAGAGASLHVVLLLGWTACTLILGWRYLQHRQTWSMARLEMTHSLTERMVGHRTRLAQEMPEHWHKGEDQELAHYLNISTHLDQHITKITALIPRGWLLIGLAGLAPAFVAGNTTMGPLAVGLGGILLAYRAFEKLVASVQELADAGISWNQIAPLFQAAARPQVAGLPTFVLRADQTNDTILQAHDLSFRYRHHSPRLLQRCNLRLNRGDRILLEGPSGSGKSTFASMLTGLKLPESGLLLLNGLDYWTLGDREWRRRVVSAPQFHENYVFTETLGFNLLMGRGWPPKAGDFEEAETICRALGLGNLIDRMPAGLQQRVGETGWQLSHGERSRLYMARALLQNADLVILDESFAALDPENLNRAMACVLDRTSTLLVIAHP